jgi:hypothetical protein
MPDELSRMKDIFYETLMLYEDFIREWGNLREEAWKPYMEEESREIMLKIGNLSREEKLNMLNGMAFASRRFKKRIDCLYVSARDCQELSISCAQEIGVMKDKPEIPPFYEKTYFDKGIDMSGIAFFEVCIPFLEAMRK